MKVSELTGVQLDYWVAKSLGWEEVETGLGTYDQGFWQGDGVFIEKYQFSPSTNWAQAGPLIERENISILRDGVEGGDQWLATIGGWMSHDFVMGGISMPGNTALEAAMRCKVVSVYGDEVPDL